MCRQRCGIKETPAHNGNVNYYTQRSLEKLTMEPLYIYIYIQPTIHEYISKGNDFHLQKRIPAKH